MDNYSDLDVFEPETQRLVIQMQAEMTKIWKHTRGAMRTKKIAEFNIRIANIIEWKSNKVKKELDEANEQINVLNDCLDKQFQKKWRLLSKISELESQLASKLEKCHIESPVITKCTPDAVRR